MPTLYKPLLAEPVVTTHMLSCPSIVIACSCAPTPNGLVPVLTRVAEVRSIGNQ